MLNAVMLVAQAAQDVPKSLSERLVDYGLQGILIAVIVSMTWALLRKTLDSRESDLAWHRAELDKKRQEYLGALKEQQQTYKSSLEQQQKVFEASLEQQQEMFKASMEKMTAAICSRLDHVDREMDAIRQRIEAKTERKT